MDNSDSEQLGWRYIVAFWWWVVVYI